MCKAGESFFINHLDNNVATVDDWRIDFPKEEHRFITNFTGLPAVDLSNTKEVNITGMVLLNKELVELLERNHVVSSVILKELVIHKHPQVSDEVY